MCVWVEEAREDLGVGEALPDTSCGPCLAGPPTLVPSTAR